MIQVTNERTIIKGSHEEVSTNLYCLFSALIEDNEYHGKAFLMALANKFLSLENILVIEAHKELEEGDAE